MRTMIITMTLVLATCTAPAIADGDGWVAPGVDYQPGPVEVIHGEADVCVRVADAIETGDMVRMADLDMATAAWDAGDCARPGPVEVSMWELAEVCRRLKDTYLVGAGMAASAKRMSPSDLVNPRDAMLFLQGTASGTACYRYWRW